MAFGLAKKHAFLGGGLVLALVVYMWCIQLLPNIDKAMPTFNERISNIVHPIQGNKCQDGGHGKHSNSTLSICDDKRPSNEQVQRPPEVNRTMGLVFYGRRQTVSILDCYLKRNLVKNGGVLDGIIFLQRTHDKEDLAILDKLIEGEPDYEKWEIDISETGYATSYEKIEDDVLYVKMDDDIVFIEDTVIPSIISTKAAHPEYFMVSANVVNQPLISWIHWNLGVIKPYLPELDTDYPEPKEGEKFDWRASLLPAWEGSDKFDVKDWTSPGEKKHRWLPLKNRTDHVLDRTPIMETEYDAFGKGWSKWQLGAQEHYSLFEHLEKKELNQYRFHTWDFQYRRMGIQFIAILGKDINRAKPIAADDEQHLAVTVPQRLGRHAVADGGGVAAHYSFSAQTGKAKMQTTDILDRYRAYAAEFVCKGPMIWDPSMETEE